MSCLHKISEYNRVVRKLQFQNNFHLKMTCEGTNRVPSQVKYTKIRTKRQISLNYSSRSLLSLFLVENRMGFEQYNTDLPDFPTSSTCLTASL